VDQAISNPAISNPAISNPAISIGTLEEVSARDAEALARLLAQLSASAAFDVDRINEIVDHDATELLVARLGGQIVGMATFVTFPLPSGAAGVTSRTSWSTTRCAGAELPGNSSGR